MRVEVFERGRRPLAGLHDGDDALTPARIGHAHHDGVEHGVVPLEGGFDFFRVHLLATGVDGDGPSPEECDRAVVLDAGVVTRYRPAHAVPPRERRRRLLRILVVPEWDTAPAGELAHDAGAGRAQLV